MSDPTLRARAEQTPAVVNARAVLTRQNGVGNIAIAEQALATIEAYYQSALSAAEARIQQVTAERDHLREWSDAWERRARKNQGQLAALQEALVRYGGHDLFCTEEACICGFAEALRCNSERPVEEVADADHG